MIDELVSYLQAEIAMDGDQGTPLDRLQTFINTYYQKHSSSPQYVDAAFVTYIIDVLRRTPQIRIGYLQACDSDIKSARIGPKQVLVALPPTTLTSEALTGDLRIAVDAETTWLMQTGSHARPSKITQAVYEILQSISQNREQGKTVVQLGKEFSHDQKSMYHFAKVLVSLNLIVKIPFVINTNMRTSLLIHTRYASSSVHYEKFKQTDDASTKDVAEEEDSNELRFTPITLDTIAKNSNLVKSRIMKLLQASSSSNFTCPLADLYRLLGFPPFTSSKERRFFYRYIGSLVTSGILEKVTASVSGASASSQCVRLRNDQHCDESIIKEGEDDIVAEQPFGSMDLEHQALNHLIAAGSSGMIIKELAWALGDINMRTAEAILVRLELQQLPLNTQDCTVRSFKEAANREQRRRYFSLQGYIAACKSMGLNPETSQIPESGDPKDAVLDPEGVGDFNKIGQTETYRDRDGLDNYMAACVSSSKRPIGRPRIGSVKSKDSIPKKRGRPPKAATKKSTAAKPASNKGRGRPRKYPRVEANDEQSIQENEEDLLTPDVPVPNDPSLLNISTSNIAMSPLVPTHSDIVPPDSSTPNVLLSQSTHASPNVPITSNDKTSNRKSRKKMQPLIVKDVETTKTLSEVSSTGRPMRSARLKSKPIGSFAEDEDMVVNVSSGSEFAEESDQEQALNEELTEDLKTAHSANVQNLESIPMDLSEELSNPHFAKSLQEMIQHSETVAEENSDIVDEDAPSTKSRKSKLKTDSESPNPSPSPSFKRRRGNYERVNASELQRQNILTSIVDAQDGIIDMTDLQNKFAAHFKETDGYVVDRTTFRKSLSRLVSLNVFKRITVTADSIGRLPKREIVFRSGIDSTSPQMSKFIISYRKSANAHGSRPNIPHVGNIGDLNHLGISANAESTSEQTTDIREQFKADWHVISLYYGGLTGHMARARELHTYLVSKWGSREEEIVPDSNPPIFSTAYLFYRLPFSIYMKILPYSQYDINIENAVRDSTIADVRVGDLDSMLRSILLVGQSKTKSRLDVVLKILCQLQLLMPLKLEDPDEQSASNFKFSPAEDLRNVTFWQLNSIAPIYHFRSQQDNKPLLCVESVDSPEHAATFWTKLHQACRYRDANSIILSRDSGIIDFAYPSTFVGPKEFINAITMSKRWSSEQLSSKQTDYLRPYASTVNPQDEVRIAELSHITMAPLHVIKNFIIQTNVDLTTKKRETHRRQKSGSRKTVVESSEKRESSWSQIAANLNAKYHLDRLDPSVLQILHKWYTAPKGLSSRKIHDASKSWIERRMQGDMIPLDEHIRSRYTNEGSLNQISSTNNTTTVPSQSMILDESTSLMTQKMVKSKDKNSRHRFHDSHDTILQDAYVIVKARSDAFGKIMLWKDITALFPGVRASVVRNRHKRIEQRPGLANYLKLLQREWADIWMQYRGSKELPDLAPSSVTDFGLEKHIEFLRKHINKESLWNTASTTDMNDYHEIDIPSDISKVPLSWLNDQSSLKPVKWDAVWSSGTLVARMEQLHENMFTIDNLDMNTSDESLMSHEQIMASEVVKMILSTLPEDYSTDRADELLKLFPNTDKVIEYLLKKNIIARCSKKHHRNQTGPERAFQYASISQFNDPLIRDLHDNLEDTAEGLLHNEEVIWPLISGSSEAFLLAAAVSNSSIEVSIDTSFSAPHRSMDNPNTRKMTDEDFENGVIVKLKDKRMGFPKVSDPVNMRMIDPPSIDLGQGHSNAEESCYINGPVLGGKVSCGKCISASIAHFKASLNQEKQKLVSQIVAIIQERLIEGISISNLLSCFNDHKSVMKITDSLCHINPPAIMWNPGTDCMRLVYAEHIKDFTVKLSKTNNNLQVMPRYWFDIFGKLIPSLWKEATSYVWYHVYNYPGITMYQLVTNISEKSSCLLLPWEIYDALNSLTSSKCVRREENLEDSLNTVDCDLQSWEWHDWRYYPEVFI